jgi:hypothetical protein
MVSVAEPTALARLFEDRPKFRQCPSEPSNKRLNLTKREAFRKVPTLTCLH